MRPSHHIEMDKTILILNEFRRRHVPSDSNRLGPSPGFFSTWLDLVQGGSQEREKAGDTCLKVVYPRFSPKYAKDGSIGYWTQVFQDRGERSYARQIWR